MACAHEQRCALSKWGWKGAAAAKRARARQWTTVAPGPGPQGPRALGTRGAHAGWPAPSGQGRTMRSQRAARQARHRRRSASPGSRAGQAPQAHSLRARPPRSSRSSATNALAAAAALVCCSDAPWVGNGSGGGCRCKCAAHRGGLRAGGGMPNRVHICMLYLLLLLLQADCILDSFILKQAPQGHALAQHAQAASRACCKITRTTFALIVEPQRPRAAIACIDSKGEQARLMLHMQQGRPR